MTAVAEMRSESAPAALALDGVTVRFGGLVALDDVSFAAQPGEIVGIIGPNGAGKTTLLNVVTGIVRPDRGSVVLCGVNCTRWPVHRRARQGLARTFQRVTLFSELTLTNHLRLAVEGRYAMWAGKAESGETAVNESLALLSRLGWDVDGTESVAGLPLGRARLVELAMSLATKAQVLLLDEPLSGLPRGERESIASAIKELRDASGSTVLIVEHDLEAVARLADRLVVLDFGKKIAEGAVQEVLADEGVKGAYFGGRRR